MTYTKWSEKDIQNLRDAYEKKTPDISTREFCRNYADVCGRDCEHVRNKLIALDIKSTIPLSPYPVYDEPLTMEGDALILPDVESPFYHAEFMSGCLDLANEWGIRQCIIPGDLIHLDSLSPFHPNWKKTNDNGLSAKDEKTLMNMAMNLPKKYQGEVMETIVNIGERENGDGLSTELRVTRELLRRLESQFDRIDYSPGNHEGRFLRTLQAALDVGELRRLLILDRRWRIAPYYFSILISNGQKFRITHPKNYGKGSVRKLVPKFLCHVIMTHGHHTLWTTDPSGNYIAAEIGCCVDEDRLPYAAQRDNTQDKHILGAAIVRNGYLWLLNKFTDWEKLRAL